MTIQETIEKAWEAGYANDWSDLAKLGLSQYKTNPQIYASVFLDPSFWQSLGRVMGWDIDDYRFLFGKDHRVLATRFSGMAYTVDTWQYHWHRFIDHLAEGKSAESFFGSLAPQ